MNNKIANIGDSLLVRITPLIAGKVHFSGFTQVVNGVTTTRTLEQQYRISSDDIFWTDWKELNIANISQEVHTTDNSLIIEVKYTRGGTDTTGEIEFVSIQFQGNREEITFIAPTLSASIFGEIVGTEALQKTERNFFKKLYFRGIIPEYIKRGDNVSYTEDKDYIDFFNAVARFFALIIRFFKRFESFRTDEPLLREQIRGYNIFFNESNVSLEELQYIAENILSIIQQRGTGMIFVRKGELLPNGTTAAIDGEMLRLIRSRVCDEILYDSIPNYKMGWCLGNASPLYKGTSRSYNLNKTAENTQNFGNLSKYVISRSSLDAEECNYSLATLQDGKKTLHLTVNENQLGTNTASVGLGRIGTTTPALMYVEDAKLDYEITFAFKIQGAAGNNVKLLFAVEGFDINGILLDDAYITTDNNAVTGQFFNVDLSNFVPGVWYNVRGIIHAYSTQFFESTTNIGRGKNLIVNNPFLKYMLPKIQISGANQTIVDIWDFKIRPLVHGKNIQPLKDGSTDAVSLGFIQSAPILYTYMRNNNNSLSQDEITDIIERYLFPFDSINLFTVLSNF